MDLTVRILGTRGVPANHGGFETAAGQIGLELVRRGWRVIVYCQTPGASGEIREDVWNGIERVHIPERFKGPAGTIWFDAAAVRHAAEHDDVCLTFGYNTAFLNERLRLKHVPTIINMDGVEWKRARWSPMQRKYLHLQERLACRIGDHLIADHPEIAKHLRSVAPASEISTITYGAPHVDRADPTPVQELGLQPDHYLSLIARPVAENSILEIVSTFSRRSRGLELVVLGDYRRHVDYERAVLDAASDEVRFVGPQYDPHVVQSIRFHSRAYVHGHTVGGTNPSLVEALGCGNAVIAHDNKFNRWVAGDAGLYFGDPLTLERCFDDVATSRDVVTLLSKRARARHAEEFGWDTITDRYEDLLLRHAHPAARRRASVLAANIPQQRRPADLTVRAEPAGKKEPASS